MPSVQTSCALPPPLYPPTSPSFQANWPDLYKASALSLSNAEYAENLVLNDAGCKPPLRVDGGQYASDWKTQACGRGGGGGGGGHHVHTCPHPIHLPPSNLRT